MGTLLLLGLPPALVQAAPKAPNLDCLNRQLAGQVVDYTHNHGSDNRLWSPALCQKRDLYIYLPPGFDPHFCYPVMLWLHGLGQDEQMFLEDPVHRLDAGIACGQLPPFIIAAPDGSLSGDSSGFGRDTGSFFINSKAGNFEDYVMQDVWGFLLSHYPIRPEREAHVLAGVSMGGGSAYHLGLRYRDCFKILIGIFPPLNSRWVDCHCRYRANFDPCCWGWRQEIRPREVVGRYYGVIVVRSGRLSDPLFERGPEGIAAIIRDNPIEQLIRSDLHDGELDMYIAYGGRDQFNIDAQIESFLYVARQRCLTITVGYDPKGKHDRATARRLLPDILNWLGPRLAPYGPVPICPGTVLPAGNDLLTGSVAP